jgi:hypothetical protein
MGVVSVRLTEKEEKILKYLSQYYVEDKSSLIKHSLMDLYEDIKDLEVINHFENREKQKKTKFITSNDILKKIK